MTKQLASSREQKRRDAIRHKREIQDIRWKLKDLISDAQKTLIRFSRISPVTPRHRTIKERLVRRWWRRVNFYDVFVRSIPKGA